MSSKKAASPTEAQAPEASSDAALARPIEQAEELKLHNDLLAEENRTLREQLEALKGIGAKAKEADSTGAKRPFSKVHMFGHGHRVVNSGDPLHDHELPGLSPDDYEWR